MKNCISILKCFIGILLVGSPLYVQSDNTTPKNIEELRKNEEIARKNALENPTKENIDKHKTITKQIIDAVEEFNDDYSKDPT